MIINNILLSYPRSGNHLVRFFIELLSETPTYGCKSNQKDIEIYKNIFPKKVPFNISKFEQNDCYYKYHIPPSKDVQTNNLILIIRNPKEVLLRYHKYKLNFYGRWDSFESYFNNIDFYNNHKGKKLLLFYEDIITNKSKFIDTLYNFLNINKPEKKEYILSNIDELYYLSSKGKNRDWAGIQSNNIDSYYTDIPVSIKKDFDNYLDNKLKNYVFLKEKYNI